MTTELTIHKPMTTSVWQMISEAAPVIHASRLFGVSSTAQAQAIMLKGYELGFPFTASFEFVRVIEGRPELIPRGALAMLHASPVIKRIEIKRLTVNGTQYCGHEVTIERVNGFTYTARWTLEDAKRADLLKPKSGWEKYPENMCLWRAVGFAADVAAPDVLMGNTGLLTRPEQFGVAISEQGDIIESEPRVLLTVNFLIEKYGVEAVLAANDGNIPETQEAIDAVAAKLEGK